MVKEMKIKYGEGLDQLELGSKSAELGSRSLLSRKRHAPRHPHHKIMFGLGLTGINSGSGVWECSGVEGAGCVRAAGLAADFFTSLWV
jgi:hypothetical protein